MKTQCNGSGRKRCYGACESVVLLMLAASLPSLLVSGVLVKDHVRTLWSLEQVPGTQMYVMDYYCDYNIEKIREEGMDPSDVEGSLIRAYLPRPLAPSREPASSSYHLRENNRVLRVCFVLVTWRKRGRG